MDEFTTYIEVITHYRVKFHRQYLTECLDSLLLKNRPGAMIAQPTGRRSAGSRSTAACSRCCCSCRCCADEDSAARTCTRAPLRVDEFLAILRDRYGLYIDQLPDGDGFGPAIVTDHAALRENRAAFIARLREIGFYSRPVGRLPDPDHHPPVHHRGAAGMSTGLRELSADDIQAALERVLAPRLIRPARQRASPATARASMDADAPLAVRLCERVRAAVGNGAQVLRARRAAARTRRGRGDQHQAGRAAQPG